MKITFDIACRAVLVALELDNIPVVESFSCYYDHINNYIGMNIEDACSLEKEWYENVSQYLSNGRDFNLILWSLLHEYGHYQDTLETWNDEDETLCRELMYMMPEDSYERRMAYFNLPSEKVATKWAADFIRENEIACREANEFLEKYVIQGELI